MTLSQPSKQAKRFSGPHTQVISKIFAATSIDGHFIAKMLILRIMDLAAKPCIQKDEALGFEHHGEITSQMGLMDLHLAEFCFPNLYLFRETHEYRVLKTEHSLFIAGVSYDKQRYLMPLVRPETAVAGCFEDLKALVRSGDFDMIFPIPEE